jgi:ankyrin repeat protein
VLLEAGANPNAQDHHGGRTPLHQAAAQGYKQVCKKLLSCGADAKIKVRCPASVNPKAPNSAVPHTLHPRQMIRDLFCRTPHPKHQILKPKRPQDKPESPNLDAIPGIREAIAEMPPITDDCGPDKVTQSFL